jgi:hypothetical protein
VAAPTALASVAGGANVGGGVFGAIGALTTGAANAAMYNYKAGMALINKQVADQNAQWDIQSGDVSAEEKGLQGGQAIGATKVAQSGAGVDVNSGTAAVVRQNQTSSIGYDQSIIKWNAGKKAYGQEVAAAGDQAESVLDTSAASNAKTAGDIAALSSVLGSVSSVASKWSQANTLGIGTGGSSDGFDETGGKGG